jgi:hypothetical protein
VAPPAMFDHENKTFSGAIKAKRQSFFSKRGEGYFPGILWSRFCKEDYNHMIKLFFSSITKFMKTWTGSHLDALRWTMNFYHNVIDSVSYSYLYWKSSIFFNDKKYPIQNNSLLGNAIMTCSMFFKKFGVNAS